MRNGLIVLVLSLFTAAAAANPLPNAKIAQLPNGTLTGHTYSNDAIGITYEYPANWIAATDPNGSMLLDPEHPGALGNQCSRVLVLIQPPGKVEGRFSSLAALVAVAPECLSGPEFPQSLSEIKKVNKVADVFIKRFRNSPFFSPYGATILESDQEGHVVILLTGGMTINAVMGKPGHPAATKEPLVVHTSLALTQSKGYWIFWAYTADEPSVEELKQTQIHFSDGK